MKKNRFPKGWNEERVQQLLQELESQTDDEAIAEAEAAYEDTTETMMSVPVELVPKVRQMIAEMESHKQ